jgi:hypothetical protein
MSSRLKKGNLYRVVGKRAWAEYGSIVQAQHSTYDMDTAVRCRILFGAANASNYLGATSPEVHVIASEVEDYTS